MNPSSIKFLSVFVWMLILCLKGFAQNPNDLFSVNYTYIPVKGFRDMVGKSPVHNLEAILTTPSIKLGKRTMVSNSLYYKESIYDFDEMPAGWNGLPEHLHDIRYSLVLRHQLNSKWSLLVVPRLNIRSDFKEGPGGDDLFPGITALAIRPSLRKPNFAWGFGISYNNDFRHNMMIPALAFYYTSATMRVNVLLPNNGQVVLTPAKKLEYGLSFNIDPAIYHTNTGTINGFSVKYVRTFNALVSPLISYKVVGNTWLNARVGYVLFRNYDLWNGEYEAGDETMKNSFNPSPFVSIGVSMRLNKP